METSFVKVADGSSEEERVIVPCRCCGAGKPGAHVVRVDSRRLEEWRAVERRFDQSFNPLMYILWTLLTLIVVPVVSLVALWQPLQASPWPLALLVVEGLMIAVVSKVLMGRRERRARKERRDARAYILSTVGLSDLDPDQVRDAEDAEHVQQYPSYRVLLAA